MNENIPTAYHSKHLTALENGGDRNTALKMMETCNTLPRLEVVQDDVGIIMVVYTQDDGEIIIMGGN